MKNIKCSEIMGRSWLNVIYDEKEIKFAYPPVQGTHTGCFKAINSDSELIPAEGLELSLLTYGAFSENSKLWQYVKDRCIIGSYTRIPKRLTWIPLKNEFNKLNEFAGVFIERDLKGIGLSSKMDIPENIDGWKEQNGIYTKDNMIFVPIGTYVLGEHSKDNFVKDGFAIALLAEEGAEIFAKTAYDNNKILYNFGSDINEINSQEQRVAVLDSDGDRLDLYGYGYGYYRNGFSFGVSSRKISTGNKG